VRGRVAANGFRPLLSSISVELARDGLKAGCLEAVWKGGRVDYFVWSRPSQDGGLDKPQMTECNRTVQTERFGPGMLPCYSLSRNIIAELGLNL
jgi:hypothetical protein